MEEDAGERGDEQAATASGVTAMGSAAAAAVISDEERVMNAGCGCKGKKHYEGLDRESVRLNRFELFGNGETYP